MAEHRIDPCSRRRVCDHIRRHTAKRGGESGSSAAVVVNCLASWWCVMTFDDVFARVRQPILDPEQRTRLTVDTILETGDLRARTALEAAAVPHSFNATIFARLLEVELPEAEALTRELAGFSFVETFPLRGGWNVHKLIRLAVRLKLHREEPER